MNLRCLIVDDEELGRMLIENYVQRLGFTIVAQCRNPLEAMQIMQTKEIDLIFLDILLSDGLSFEIFEQIEIKSAVIFTTAFDEYALRAFKLNSIDYLLKPIDEDDLSIAITKFKNQFQKSIISSLDFEAIKRMLVNPIERTFNRWYVRSCRNRIKSGTIFQS